MDPLIGEIRAFPFPIDSPAWLPCDGSLKPIAGYRALFDVVGTTFGSGPGLFALPDLRGRAAVGAGQGPGLSAYALGATAGQERVALTLQQITAHTHSPSGTLRVSTKPGSSLSPAGAYLATSTSNQYGEQKGSEMSSDSVKGVADTVGNNEGHENRQPFLALNYVISASGQMEVADAYTGEVRLYGGKTPPQGWAFCDGSLLDILEYVVLYQVIGTIYGQGPGTFALPNTRSLIVVSKGHGPGLTDYSLGQQLGTETVALNRLQAPDHQHPITGNVQVVTSAASSTADPDHAYFADKGVKAYGAAAGSETLASVAMNGTMQPAGGNSQGDALPHANVQPVQALNYIICLVGVYPQPN